jgi:hypothetical protein
MNLYGRVVRVVVAALVTLSGLGCSTTVSGGSPKQPCSPSARFSNQYGAIDVQQAGRGAGIQWGVSALVPADLFYAEVFINGVRYDKKDQNYPPHGSINVTALHTNDQVSIIGHATNSAGQLNYGILCRSA